MAKIAFDNVSVIYRQRRERMLLRDHLREIARRMPEDGFYALHDVSFSIDQGESVGVVGANGAGKSTLLAVLAGLIPPDRGKVAVEGRIGALLELGGGFHPDLTGRENIFMNAAIMGLTEKQARADCDSIIEFSELAEFIDEPLRTYSAGMTLRLGFSVAMHSDLDILLVDEILAVGDLAFQKKCYRRILELRQSGKTIVCVSHAPGIIEELCGRLIWLHHGHLVKDGDYESVGQDYSNFMSDPGRRLQDDIPSGPLMVAAKAESAKPAKIKKKSGR